MANEEGNQRTAVQGAEWTLREPCLQRGDGDTRLAEQQRGARPHRSKKQGRRRSHSQLSIALPGLQPEQEREGQRAVSEEACGADRRVVVEKSLIRFCPKCDREVKKRETVSPCFDVFRHRECNGYIVPF